MAETAQDASHNGILKSSRFPTLRDRSHLASDTILKTKRDGDTSDLSKYKAETTRKKHFSPRLELPNNGRDLILPEIQTRSTKKTLTGRPGLEIMHSFSTPASGLASPDVLHLEYKNISSLIRPIEENQVIEQPLEEFMEEFTKYLTDNLEPSDTDWRAITNAENIDEETQKVRKLEAWQFQMMKEKVSGTLKTSQPPIQFKKRVPSQSHQDQPEINVKLLGTILADTEIGRDSRKGGTLISMTDSVVQANKKSTDLVEGNMQSLQNAIRETNQELLYELLQKKIKGFLHSINIDKMTREQLKLHTRMIALSVLEQFKALKGATNITMIQNRIESIIERLRPSKAAISEDSLRAAKEALEKIKAKPVTDYKSLETNFIKNSEKSSELIQELREKLKNLNKQCLKLKQQINPIQAQVDQLDDKKDIMSSPFSRAFPEGVLNRRKNARSGLLAITEESDEQNKTSGSLKDENEKFIPVSRIERQKLKLELTSKLKDMQGQLAKLTHDIEFANKELQNARNLKINYRIQLKELYYQMLKDEATLLDINNTLDYTWAVRALWRMQEEVKPHLFPNFLESNSINYLLKYAKLQNELEDHCRQNNLIFLISNLDEFKDSTAANDMSKMEDTQLMHVQHMMNMSGEGSSMHSRTQKNYNELLESFNEKMVSMKKVNLKAKKLTNTTLYNSKGKYTVSKWEEVDPLKLTVTLVNPNEPEKVVKQDDTPKLDEFKMDLNTIRKMKTPADRALEIMEALKKIRNEEITRTIKQNLARDLDEKQRTNLKKIFRFLFGRREGEKGYYQCINDKKSWDQKNANKMNVYYQKSVTDTETQSSPKLTIGLTCTVENQIWNNPRTDAIYFPDLESPKANPNVLMKFSTAMSLSQV